MREQKGTSAALLVVTENSIHWGSLPPPSASHQPLVLLIHAPARPVCSTHPLPAHILPQDTCSPLGFGPLLSSRQIWATPWMLRGSGEGSRQQGRGSSHRVCTLLQKVAILGSCRDIEMGLRTGSSCQPWSLPPREQLSISTACRLGGGEKSGEGLERLQRCLSRGRELQSLPPALQALPPLCPHHRLQQERE